MRWPDHCMGLLRLRRGRDHRSEENTNETPAHDWPGARRGAVGRAGPCRRAQRSRAHRDAEEGQGNRRHQYRLPRLLDPVLLSGRQPEADRLCDRHLPQNRRRREGRTQARQARGRIQSGDVIDLHCGSTTNNPERLKQVAFTNTHFLTATRFVSKKSANLHSIDDLKGKTVVSTAGTTNIKQLTEANAARNLNLNIVPAKEHAESFLMVETDRAVAAVLDDILLASFVAGSKDPDVYVISKDAFSKPEPYGIMLRKDDPAFKKVADAATAALYTSGEGQKLYDKWFMQKIPPKGLNLNSPISPELKAEFAKPSDSPEPDSYKAM